MVLAMKSVVRSWNSPPASALYETELAMAGIKGMILICLKIAPFGNCFSFNSNWSDDSKVWSFPSLIRDQLFGFHVLWSIL